MQELGPMMRALELQRLIEDKVTEWRQRSSRVVGASIADSYQQPVNFARRANRRKNGAEINRIIAKYSKTNKRADERHVSVESPPRHPPPIRPARKKTYNNLKASKSEDNLTSFGMDTSTDPDPAEIKPPPRFNFKYNAKSYEDVTAFVDVDRSRKSMIYGENSILNAKPARRKQLHSICEATLDTTEFKDSGIEIRSECFATSTPISKRKTYTEGDTLSGFKKCAKYATNVFKLRKGSSEPDILKADDSLSTSPNVTDYSSKSDKVKRNSHTVSVNTSVSDVDSVGHSGSKTLDAKKRWNILKSPVKRGSIAFLLPWRKKKRGEKDRKCISTYNGCGYLMWNLSIQLPAPNMPWSCEHS